MSNRISLKNLNALCDRINSMVGAPMVPYSKDADGTYHANIGNYHISAQCGGYCLHRLDNEAGGVDSPFRSGHISARDLYYRMQAFYEGLSAMKEHINEIQKPVVA